MTLTKYRDFQELFAGCVAYYDGSLNPAGKLQDLIGENHGTITGATKTGTDRFGTPNRIMSFDGSDDYVYTGVVPSSVGTILIWIKTTSTVASRYFIGEQHSTNNPYSWISIGSIGNGQFTCAFGGASASQEVYCNSTGLSINNGSWHFLGMTWNSSVGISAIYNGDIIKTTLAALRGDGHIGFNIGSLNYNTSYSPIAALIGEVYIFNRVLSVAEIKTLYNFMYGRYMYPIIPGVRGVL